jgi:ubiquinone/menaquinone biosynthesis C-methylase UbiE
MTLKAMYNHIADHYDFADQFGSISQSHQCAMNQLNRLSLLNTQVKHILDMGVGDGAFLKKLYHAMPKASYTGIDVSAGMLKLAESELPLRAIETSATQATDYVSARSQDLVLAHFINAYVPTDALFAQASQISQLGGHFSFITTTYDAFPVAQNMLTEFICKKTFLSRIVGHYYQSVIQKTTVATNQNDLLQAFSRHHFKIIDHQRLEIPIELNNIEALAQFGIEGTWFLNTLSIKILPKVILVAYLKHLFKNIFQFPYRDKHIIDVVLAERV